MDTIFSFFKKIFGFLNSKEDTLKSLAFTAGVLVRANNPQYAIIASILKDLLNSIEKGDDKEKINSAFTELLKKYLVNINDEKQKTAIFLLLAGINFSSVNDIKGDIDIKFIKVIVIGFLNGMGM